MLWAPSPGVVIPQLNRHQDETQASGVVTSPAQEPPGTIGRDKEGSPEEGPSQISLQRGSRRQGINKTGVGGWQGAEKEGTLPGEGPACPSTCTWGLGATLQGKGRKRTSTQGRWHPGAAFSWDVPLHSGPSQPARAGAAPTPSTDGNAEAPGGCPPHPVVTPESPHSEGER